jgi:DNA-binding response OmpR family regulator
MSVRRDPIRLGIVDSDSGFLKVLAKRLEGSGYEYRVLPGGIPPEELVASKLNALLIDPSVLRSDPWDFLEKVGSLLPGLGVIVCSQDSTVAQRVRGLRVGADDWIAKPCHPEEVVARVEAVVRRHRRGRPRADEGPMVFGEIEIRPDRFQAYVAGQSLGLTRREYELLHVLAEAEGRVIEREALYQSVWGYAMAHGDRSVDVFVRKLRAKLTTNSPGWEYIHTHFGIGYRFEPEPHGGEAAEGPQVQPEAADEPEHSPDSNRSLASRA